MKFSVLHIHSGGEKVVRKVDAPSLEHAAKAALYVANQPGPPRFPVLRNDETGERYSPAELRFLAGELE